MAEPLNLAALERALEGVGAGQAGVQSSEQWRALRAAAKEARRGKPPALVSAAVEAVNAQRNVEGARLGLRAVKDHPECAPGYLASAVALERLGFLAEALAFYEQALARSPNDPSICALLGATAGRCRQPKLAEQFYRLAVQLEPNEPAHLNNLAGVLRDLGRFDDAIELLRQRLYLNPELAALWNTLGTVVQEQGDAETAQTFLAEAARLDPKNPGARHNAALALADLGRFEEAEAALDVALTLADSDAARAEMRSARAYARLGAGHLAGGWEDYEARFDPLTREPTFIHAHAPRWDRQSALAGKHLLVMGEQGLGDEVIFMSALPDAVAAAGQVTIACEKRLAPLVARSFPSARVIGYRTQLQNGRLNRFIEPGAWEGVDLWAPLADLAVAYRPTTARFPDARGYLIADPARVGAFRAQLAGAPGLKIGIAWKSLIMTGKRARGFAPFAAWAPLLTAPNAVFYSLQYGSTDEEEAYAAEKWGLSLRKIEGLDVKDDLEGVAAAGCALDLVIGPANASTNLAAACGGDVWFMVRRPAWPMLGTAGMPWYPHTRVFCAGEKSWHALFEEIASAARERSAPA